MSMTKYMHPRNIYKTPPNFKQLAIEFPEFRKHVKQELTGKVSLDFKNLEALSCLSCTLLKKDFGLDVQIPLDKLIPTIPLRLNYILWIEDLMEISRVVETSQVAPIKGIDIGTGASCVYPLLAAKRNAWQMLATDIDEKSLTYARENVSRNQLTELIHVKKSNKDVLLLDLFTEEVDEYDFCMCNPPFFATHQETIFQFKSRKESRPRPKNAFCGAPQEVVAHGGEVAFITKMIKESQQLLNKIRIYTTMIGHASSLSPLKKLLREIDVVSFKQTEFCQGNTTRWGLAWTFCDIDLRKVPETTLTAQRKLKLLQKNAFNYQIMNVPENVTLNDFHLKLVEIFDDLQFVNTVKVTKSLITYDVEAQSNTWSHQRRKRRAAQRSGNNSGDSTSNELRIDDNGHEVPCVEKTTEMIDQMQVKSPKKRELEWDDEGFYNCKRFKNNNGERESFPFLSAKVTMFKDSKESTVNIELAWNNDKGAEKKDVLHQVLQYLKNHLKL